MFRCVAPNSPFDLMAWRNGTSLKIEVKTGYYTVSGTIGYPTHRCNDHDTLAVVVDGAVSFVGVEP